MKRIMPDTFMLIHRTRQDGVWSTMCVWLIVVEDRDDLAKAYRVFTYQGMRGSVDVTAELSSAEVYYIEESLAGWHEG